MIVKEKYLDNLVLPESVEYLRNKRLRRFAPVNPALLVLDMQMFFISESSHALVPEAAEVAGRINILKQEFDKERLPVILTRHLNCEVDAKNMGTWWRDILKEEDSYSELTPAINTKGAEVVVKSQYDAFEGTKLDNLLKSREIDTLFITGVMTHLCCETTAREAFVKGYNVFFGIDCTATYNREFHNASLLNISHGFGVPVYSNEISELIRKK